METKIEIRLLGKQFLTGDISRTASRLPVVRNVTDGYGRGLLSGRLSNAVEAHAEGMVPTRLAGVSSSGTTGLTALAFQQVTR